jgi:diguanylate cyclase (GGDEF)-like protein/PAS domain S-box-containing protein
MSETGSDAQGSDPTSERLNQFLRSVIAEAGPQGVVNCFASLLGATVITQDGVVVASSSAFESLSEYDRAALNGKSVSELIPPGEQQRMNIRFATDDTAPYELQLLCRSGRIKPVRVSPRIFDSNGAKYRLAEFWDISEQMAYRAALSESEAKYRSVFDQAAVGIARVSTTGEWLEVNQKLCDVLGYSVDELISQTFQSITYPEDLDSDLSLLKETLAGQRSSYTMEKRYYHKLGHVVWTNLTVSLLRNAEGEPEFFVSIVEDISERKKIEAELAFVASHDELTRLGNRHMIQERFKQEVGRAERYGQPLSVFMIDIDHFKRVNDKHGHQTGDEVLQALARSLERCVRSVDFVGRLGGEEFLVLLPQQDHDTALISAERIRQTIEEHPIHTKNYTLNITVSLGVATLPDHGNTPDDLIRQADRAMYRAKREGRNRVASANANASAQTG